MIQTAADNQSKLLSVINDLFTYVIDPYSGKKVIRINQKLRYIVDRLHNHASLLVASPAHGCTGLQIKAQIRKI